MVTQHPEHERRDATEEEIKELRHVVDSVSLAVWVALIANATERFTFYAVTTPWQNYIQNPVDSVAVPGALGLGQATATNITSAFLFLSFLLPTVWAIISDTWLGRHKTLCLSYFLNFCGCLIIFVTSLPAFSHSQITKVVGLGFAMIILGIGTAGVKATASPFIGDQYAETAPQVITTKKGERVIADRALTLQYIYNVSYWFTNIASLSLVASTYLEKLVGFWAAYLLPLCATWTLVPLLLIFHKSLVKQKPQANILPRASRVIVCAGRHKFNWEAATPVYQSEKFGRQVEWDDKFVFEIKRGLQACKVMACFVPFHLCMNQITNNLVSQAGQMRLGGIPNDTIQALNSIACVLLGPVMQRFVYPIVRGRGFAFGPIARITWAFIMMSTAMAYAAGVQKLIYTKGPCYDKPLQCEKSPNDVSVWIQSPVYFLLGVGEILGFTTLAEYSYSEAPRNMRSLVQAMAQLSSGAGSALGMAFSPLSKDPQILYLYTGLSVTMITTAPTFWLMFRAYDDRVFEEAHSSDDGSNQAAEPMVSGPSDAAETGEKGDGAKPSG
ncbi:Peptide transporter PTR2 [Fusarium oxysporum f. sp. cubense]|uniref:Peptide transporter PTR2 n=1 Tax=Fusarium oxysporum f. sp. cubense TaxID=61366 RepID=A0A559LWR0_FUSOC|nr:Peptide transporter PTR2 [Fusarium oxysporum f. sp. cubense]